jgi:hypothetical protein
VPLPLTLTPTPPTRVELEGGSNVTKSSRQAVRLIEHAEPTTEFERSRPGARGDEKATEQHERLTYVSSYTSEHSSRTGASRGASGEVFSWERSLMWAECADARLLWPFFWTMSLRLASVHFRRASSDAVHDERMWSRMPHPLHLLGRPRPPRGPRAGVVPSSVCATATRDKR